MKLRFCHFILVLIFVVLSSSVIAQTSSTAISYQGTLDIAGVAADGMYDFRAVLYDSLEFGNQASPVVEVLDVEVIEGLVNLSLDFGVDAFTGEGRFLQLEVRNAGDGGGYTRLDPRQQILPTAQAVTSNTLNGRLFQEGTIGDCSVFGSTGVTGTTSFPIAYSEIPLVFLTPDISVGLGGCTTVRVSSRSETSFNWQSFIRGDLRACDCIHWLAIGKP